MTVDGQSSAVRLTIACQLKLWENSAWYPQLRPIGRALGVDAALQACIGLLIGPEEHQEPQVPFALDELSIMSEVPAQGWAWVRRRYNSAAGSVFDIEVCDDEGYIAVRLRGLSTRMLRLTDELSFGQGTGASTAVASFESGLEPCAVPAPTPLMGTLRLVPLWDPVVLSPQAVAPGGLTNQVVIVGGTPDEQSAITHIYPHARILEIPIGASIERLAQGLQELGTVACGRGQAPTLQALHVFWLVSHDPEFTLTQESILAAQQQGILACFRLIKALLQLGYGSQTLGFTVITRQMRTLHITERGNPTHASLLGLFGALAKEAAHWRIQQVDLPVDTPLPLAEMLRLPADPHCLSAASRAVLAQLSVLYQPFPLAAILDGLKAELPAWQPLLDWSLLRYDSRQDCYQLHSLTRHYAGGLLKEQDRKQAQVQLATWYQHYARHVSHSLADALEAYRLWRAAGGKQQAGQLVIELAESLRQFGLYPLLGDLCVQTLSDIGGNGQWLMGSVLYQMGVIALDQGEYEDARRLYRQSLDIAERLGNQGGQASSLHGLGTLDYLQGEYEEARGHYQQSLSIAERLEDQNGQAISLHQLGMIALDQGEYESAREFYQQSLAIEERLGNQGGRAGSLHQLGVIAKNRGEYEEARGLYRQSLDISEQLRDWSGQANCLHGLGTLAYLQGEYEEARGLYQQSLDIFERLGDQRGRALVLHSLGMIAQDQKEYEEASSLYQQSLEIKERLGNQSGQANSLGRLGSLFYEQGNFEKALIYTLQAYILFDTLQSPHRAHAQYMITRIREHMDEVTFATHWRTLAGNRPFVAAIEQEEAQSTDKDSSQTFERLLGAVSFVILQGTTEQRQQFVANLIETQQQLPLEAVPLGQFLECLAAALNGETPEVAQLVPPFTELWQEFQELLHVLPDAPS